MSLGLFRRFYGEGYHCLLAAKDEGIVFVSIENKPFPTRENGCP
jgi:hypothetical protein